MIERSIVSQKVKEFEIEKYVSDNLKNAGHSQTKVQRTPLGEKIIIFSSRPGFVIGRKGKNIESLTKNLKERFELKNPQIEISEVEDPNLNAVLVAEQIASSLERFGSKRFKAIMHKAVQGVLDAGGLGVEIIVSGKIPSTRAKSWRVYAGYLKKSGDIAIEGVRHAQKSALLKTGIIGVKVSIMPPHIVLPDAVRLKTEQEIQQEAAGKEDKNKTASAGQRAPAPVPVETNEGKEPEDSLTDKTVPPQKESAKRGKKAQKSSDQETDIPADAEGASS
ncbi:30S ribosomal protein S3 [Candidatus Woesearchaeota archaeon CG_4_10_14_0_8_um_filter_47_5]|nr:MAG: 30S ribosomal protein S3 [Candidatus Woesearchaeota archaeon CG_4_10_14_0_8_um_filter_47_5]